MIQDFPNWPNFSPDEVEAATRVLRLGRVNYWAGSEGRSFEEEFAAFCGAKHGLALANGTVALEIALRACGIGPGDEVIVTPRSFIASVSCVVNVGALPVFVDVDPTTQNVTPDTVEAAITKRTKAIIPVHLAGWPSDMPAIMRVARANGLLVIEDCAQAHGATIEGKRVGSFGDLAAFSFCNDKIMSTSGEGGILLTSDTALWHAAWSLRDHGKSYQAVHTQGHPGIFRWVHESFGTNARMTEVQAAIGRIQLEKLPDWLARRRKNAEILNGHFSDLKGLRTTVPGAGIGHAYYKYYAFLDFDRLQSGWDRDRIVAEIRHRGVPCFSGSCPEIYREGAFRGHIAVPEKVLPVANVLGKTSLMFEIHPTLTTQHVNRIVAVTTEVIEIACAQS